MKNKEILKKAIEKAVGNGFKWLHFFKNEMWIKGTIEDVAKTLINEKIYYQLIFSHEFAKAFWGETPAHQVNGKQTYWKYHLQQMVLEKEPLKYLKKFL